MSVVEKPRVITQEGHPVDEEPAEPTFEDDVRAVAEDIAQDIHKGLRKFKNGVLFKIGVIAVALKVVDVAGKIILENQRLKADRRKQDDEQ